MNLPNDETGGGADSKSLRSLSSYMYYNAALIVANNRPDAYGQYVH